MLACIVCFCDNMLISDWSFMGGSRIIIRPNLQRFNLYRKPSGCFSVEEQIHLPFYTLMVVAPKAELTKKSMESSIPYVVLGLLYAYLLYLSWTPDTIKLMFASKYWLPELPGIAKMFSNEMTLASAWIHLLAVDLFAASPMHAIQMNDANIFTSSCMLIEICPISNHPKRVNKREKEMG
ncbi:hypothetical protein LOK49_LG09G01172, partial [Camellia lanceoleosa]